MNLPNGLYGSYYDNINFFKGVTMVTCGVLCCSYVLIECECICDKIMVCFGHVLLVESLILEVFVEWQVSLEDECCPCGEDCKTPKLT